ncbi:MAG TPA: hypothetical protein VGQ04_21205 [Chitinophagaceae bacterium]|jgi:hypothetical protein|nr:hypothetical protein [Chitinophagaceae bacterium]
MKIVRKIDYYGQLILGSLMLLSVPVMLIYGFLAGLFILGCWQLLSAIFNTHSFIHTGHSKKIWSYWRYCIADLTLLLLPWFFEKTFITDNIQVFYWIAMPGAVVIAIYYLKIYKDLIQFFSLRDELDGLTKSKH